MKLANKGDKEFIDSNNERLCQYRAMALVLQNLWHWALDSVFPCGLFLWLL